MVLIYPAIFHKEDGAYWVEFPDLTGCQTFGDTLEEVMISAQEALSAYAETLLEQGKKLCEPSDMAGIATQGDSFASLVTCDLDNYMKRAKAVKKTLTIPQWLDDMAVKEGVNFSGILQNALIDYLHVKK